VDRVLGDGRECWRGGGRILATDRDHEPPLARRAMGSRCRAMTSRRRAMRVGVMFNSGWWRVGLVVCVFAVGEILMGVGLVGGWDWVHIGGLLFRGAVRPLCAHRRGRVDVEVLGGTWVVGRNFLRDGGFSRLGVRTGLEGGFWEERNWPRTDTDRHGPGGCEGDGGNWPRMVTDEHGWGIWEKEAALCRLLEH
jgi:hypothetical protein